MTGIFLIGILLPSTQGLMLSFWASLDVIQQIYLGYPETNITCVKTDNSNAYRCANIYSHTSTYTILFTSGFINVRTRTTKSIRIR